MQASVRIIPTCLDVGQAAGEACVYAQKQEMPLNEIDGVALRERLNYQFRNLEPGTGSYHQPEARSCGERAKSRIFARATS